MKDFTASNLYEAFSEKLYLRTASSEFKDSFWEACNDAFSLNDTFVEACKDISDWEPEN